MARPTVHVTMIKTEAGWELTTTATGLDGQVCYFAQGAWRTADARRVDPTIVAELVHAFALQETRGNSQGELPLD